MSDENMGFGFLIPGHTQDAVFELRAAALEATSSAILITDPSGIVLAVNPAFERLTGYGGAEIVGLNVRILNSGRNPRKLFEDLWRTILAGGMWRGELINRRKDGSFYHEAMLVAPLCDRAGVIGRFIALKDDVTERKRGEERLQMLANAVEGSPNLVGMGGPDGAIVYVNQALQQALQYSREELAGKHFGAILSPNNPPHLLEEIAAQGARPGGWHGECLVPRKDGSDLQVLLSSSAVLGDDGRPLGVLGIAQDITERRRAEEQISVLSRVLENTSEFVAVAGLAGKLTFVNPAWLRALGYAREELVGQSFQKALSPNNPPGLIEEIFGETFSGGWTGECLHRTRDGRDIPVLVSTGAVKDRHGQVIGLFGIARDITERKRVEQEIRFKNTLLEAQAETSLDGILAVDEGGHVIFSNRQFTEIWGIGSATVRTAGDEALLARAAEQVRNPAEFRERVQYLYAHRDEKAKDEIHFTNGTVIDRYSSPLVDAAGRYWGRIWYFRDITAQILAQERLQLWSRVLDQSAEGIFVCDPRERILLVNAAFERLTGYSAAEVVGGTPRILQSGRQGRAFYADMWKSILEEGVWQGEIWNRRKSGDSYVEWLSISAIRDRNGEITHYVGIFSDITTRKQDQERLARLAHHDALTGLPNRVLLMDRLDQLTRAVRRSGSQVAVLFIDLDRFKEVNDSLGHDAGDLLLQALAERFCRIIRGEDTLARLGGDEFVAVVQGLREGQDAAIIAREFLACLAPPVAVNGYELTVTASIGISLCPDDAAVGSDLIRNADAAMYQAKAAGRNAYHFYTSDLNRRALEMLSLENNLRRAVVAGEFVLYYQPQVDVRCGLVVGAEALIRWNHPELGLLLPGTFIPVAEERGLIVRIGSWVIEEAARQAALWQRAGIGIPIAVNVSAVQFRQKNFVEQLAESVVRHGITPRLLELELTESVIMRDAQSTVEILGDLHRMGFQLAIDDFGTGYSSLNYLRRFPIHRVKIDQSFVTDLERDESAVGIVTAVIGLARNLKLKVIAEGVQTVEQLEILRKHRCDQAQGFLFGPAMPASEFEALFGRWDPAMVAAPETSVEPAR